MDGKKNGDLSSVVDDTPTTLYIGDFAVLGFCIVLAARTPSGVRMRLVVLTGMMSLRAVRSRGEAYKLESQSRHPRHRGQQGSYKRPQVSVAIIM